MAKDHYTELFLEEAIEYIEELNANLLQLEKNADDPEAINEVFRIIHTLKSSAAFIGQDRLSAASHHMEDLLQLIKDGKISLDRELIDFFFAALDRISRTVNLISEEQETEDDFADIVEGVKKLIASRESGNTEDSRGSSDKKNENKNEDESESDSKIENGSDIDSDNDHDIETELTQAERTHWNESSYMGYSYKGHVRIDSESPMKNMRFILLIENLKRCGVLIKTVPDEEQLESGSENTVIKFLVISPQSREDMMQLCNIDMAEDVVIANITPNLAEPEPEPLDSPTGEKNDIGVLNEASKIEVPSSYATSVVDKTEQESRIQNKNIKVSSDKIDYLMNNVGELVITNSGLQNIYDDLIEIYGENPLIEDLKTRIENAARIARDLQTGIMKTRMIPVGLAFRRFTRPVRDLARELNKETDLVFKGENTELDKNIVDSLIDPLLHLVRNSMDHGLENVAERIKAGKPETGIITLSAHQTGNNINIEISDDGRGLNLNAIKNQAIDRGLMSPDENLSDDEIFDFIFQAGFSTSRQVTDVSGRGVGMNVVKNTVQKFNGSIRIASEINIGTSITLSFPLTLAIISSIHVRVGEEEYAFPLSDIVENVKVNRSEITAMEGRNIINMRGEILPVYRLGELLGLPQEDLPEEFPIVSVSHNDRKVGFIVDALLGKREIVIKSLDKNFHLVSGITGACLLGDGRIVMILDVQGLIEKAQSQTSDVENRTSSGIEATARYNKQLHDLAHTDSLSSYMQNPEQRKKEMLRALEARALETEERRPPQNLRITTPMDTKHIETKPETVQEIESPMKPKEISPNPPSPLDEEKFAELYKVIKGGMINAGMVLSQLLGAKVDVTVPETKFLEPENLLNYLPGESILAIALESEGDIISENLLAFDKNTGYRAACDLMGVDVGKGDEVSHEDLVSVLSELTNIIGASVVNALANKTGLRIMPSVPQFLEGSSNAIAERLDAMKQKLPNEKLHVIYISADFLREEHDLLGRLFWFVPHSSLQAILKAL